MKIAFVTGSLVHGGAERHAITLANRLAERGHECRFFYVKNDPSQLSRLRLPAACLHAQRYLDLAALRTLAASLSDIKPEVVFATNPYALMYATLARPPAPIAVTLHSTWTRTLKETLQMAAYRPLFWAAAQAIFVCERQRRHWKRRLVFARANRVIYNGVDLEHWNPRGTFGRDGVRRALGFAAGDYVIGMSAVLRPEKNPLQLVEALALLRRRGVPARALFIGDGEMRPALEARAARLGVAGDLVVTGLQQDVRPFLAACDVLAVPSFTDAFSLAAIEAMALGLPVVHADVGGAAEMIRPGHDGYLFPPGDTGTLVDCLAALADRERRLPMGRNARHTVETRFSERAMVERYEGSLTELASLRSKRESLRRSATAH
jgi:glycosyltransferase involved in cell wall biosynthesis